MNLDFYMRFRNGLRLAIAFSGVLICACAPPKPVVDVEKGNGGLVIKSIQTEATPRLTTVTFACSRPLIYGKPYALTNPARLCFEINGKLAKDFPGHITLEEGPIKEILIKEKSPEQTEVVVYARYEVTQTRLVRKGRDIILEVIPAPTEAAVAPAKPTPEAPPPSQPQILGVTVIQRPGNRTRLSITTDKKVDYDTKLEGKTLIVDLKNGTIRPDLLKRLESEHAEGAVQRVEPFYSARDRNVALRVKLRELVPYHMSQDEKALHIDFDALPVEMVQKRRVEPAAPKKRPQAPEKPPKPKRETVSAPLMESRAGLFEATSKQYAGQRMSFDFVDTDIRNILQLISEVAGINIVWGTDVSGKISMKLDNIPWDQALEMILRPNGLTYQIENDVLWVVPKARLQDMEIKEGKRKSALLAEKRVQGIFEAEIIEFVSVKHRKAYEIYTLLVGGQMDVKEVVNGKLIIKQRQIEPLLDIEAAESEEAQEGEQEAGKRIKLTTKDLFITYDAGSNTIVLNGIRSKVEKVKEIVAMLDVPEKQVMIEARIVEATTGFTRDLGIRWQSLDGNTPGFLREWYNTGSNFSGSTSFSTNTPSDTWSPNIGLAFGWLTDGGLSSIALNASLALAETDRKVNIISAPKVLTVNGELAQIMRGETAFVKIATLDRLGVQEVPALLSLNVIPTVSGDSSNIRMLVLVTDQLMAPDLNSRTEKNVSANMVVRNGETIVIGGIYRETKTLGESGVPWVKDIPILGWLFKAEEDIKAKNELLIFITPSVVNPLVKRQG